jgi:predicted  nucleic acid-binding Zn-ribbon protein
MGADLMKFDKVQKALEASQKLLQDKLLAVVASSQETGNTVSAVKEEVQQVRSDMSKIASFNFDVLPTELEEFGGQSVVSSNVDFFLSQLLLIFVTSNKLKSFSKELQLAILDVDRNVKDTQVMIDDANSTISNLTATIDSLELKQLELRSIVENTSIELTSHREAANVKQNLLADSVAGDFKLMDVKIEALRGICSNESIVRHLVSAVENANTQLRAQQDSHKVFVENTRAEMLALHSKVEGLLKEKHSDHQPAVQNFTTTIATMPFEMDSMRHSMEQTRKELSIFVGKHKRIEELLSQKADLRSVTTDGMIFMLITSK